ncbi:formin-like protein 3 [Pistacia vera]|uniref:formin-like protein 3 n=1 Tax=Pistacia vera TaxID=55513 RepID=UPI0012637D5C|nr:formin-like protein 3 [Pistacia vera]
MTMRTEKRTTAAAAERIWIHCRKELIRINAFEDFGIYFPPEGTIDLKSTVLTKGYIHKDINLLPPQMKQTLSDCIRRENLLYHVSVKEGSFEHWFLKHIKLLFSFSLPSAPRRNLISEQPRQKAKLRAPVFAPAAAPETEPKTISPGPAPASSLFGNLRSMFHPPAPAASKRPSRSPQPALGKHSPPGLQPAAGKHSPTAPQPAAGKHSPPVANQPEKDHDHGSRQMEIITAIATTAVTTFALVALIFFFCFTNRQNQIGPGDGQKDDRPLLNLSSSAGSSQKSMNLGGPGDKQPTNGRGNNSFAVRTSSMNADNNKSCPSEAPSSEAAAGLDKKSPPPPPTPGPPPPPPCPRPRPKAPPPPPPKVPVPPPKPIPGKKQPSPLAGVAVRASLPPLELNQSGAAKTKLKPFFWDKVLASPDHAMVWHEINAGSFQFNEEMIESLFGYTGDKNKSEGRNRSMSSESTDQFIRIIDTRKAQNLSIILRALNLTTEEVVDALQEGNELPVELLQSLLKMAPTADEELKLRLFSGDVSQLGAAERFLKVLINIPFAFKRLESLIFMSSHQEEVSGIKESFITLEVACNKLRSSRLFLKLLEAVLKTGNRMNDGTYRGGAQAFKLDTLLKLSDVKGTDSKTTLLHFVVQEIIRSEGIRAVRTEKASRSMSSVKSEDFIEEPNLDSEENYRSLGLQVVSGLSTELEDVKKAAVIDGDSLTAAVSKLSNSMTRARNFLDSEMKSMEEESEFCQKLTKFAESAEADIAWLLEEEQRIMYLVKNTADYFHGNSGKDEGLRLFAIVRDFLIMLDKACKEVKDTTKPVRTCKKETLTSSPSSENRQPFSDMRQKLFPAIADQRMDFSSSDDES